MNKKMSFIEHLLSVLPEASAYTHSTATDPLQQFMFAVQIGNNDKIGFQKVSGLNADLNVVEYHEGCTNYPMKLAGKATFGEVTCEKGVIPYNSTASLDSTTNVLDFLAQVAGDGTARNDVTISVLGRDGTIRAEYVLVDAFVSKWEAPDLDATSDDVAIETITFQYDYFKYTVNPSGKGSFTNWEPTGLTNANG